MKKLSMLFALVALFSIAANAQEYKKFKVGIGAGYAIPGGSGAKGGLLWTVEPAYRVNDQLAVGLRIEGAVLIRGFSEDVGESVDLDIAGISSYTLNGQYYFNNNSFRPFVGAGLGMFSLAAVTAEVDGQGSMTAAASETKFGFYPRVGFDAGHFTLALEYNLIPATEIGDAEIKNSYIGIRLGGFFGGGKK